MDQDDIQKNPHFKDLIDTKHLFNDEDRLPGRDGTPGAGMKVSEAVPLAEHWWNTSGRHQMPDYGKDPHQCLIKSGVYMGLEWMRLSKKEMLRVIAHWYSHIGVHTIIDGKSTSQDGDEKVLDDIRTDAKEILPVLGSDGTHRETARGFDDSREVDTWQQGYDQIEAEDALVDANGNKL